MVSRDSTAVAVVSSGLLIQWGKVKALCGWVAGSRRLGHTGWLVGRLKVNRNSKVKWLFKVK